jgi:hypothetical protein
VVCRAAVCIGESHAVPADLAETPTCHAWDVFKPACTPYAVDAVSLVAVLSACGYSGWANHNSIAGTA